MLDVSGFKVDPGSSVDLGQIDPSGKPGFEGGKEEGEAALRPLCRRLAELQERLWAESSQRLLVVLQAMDTGGKDGTIQNVFHGINPQGIRVQSFKAPTPIELAHDYLWRVHPHTPAAGMIAVFNRSHYEDVVAVRVRQLVPEDVWRRRFDHINAFERMLCDEGTTVAKFFLHISYEEQRERLQARLDEPDKRWKFNPGDLEDRKLWGACQEAYGDAIGRTSTANAPWYVVPADRKWYRDLVVATALIETLEAMNPRFPKPDPGLEGLVVT